jgi:hypothetical protein
LIFQPITSILLQFASLCAEWQTPDVKSYGYARCKEISFFICGRLARIT